MRAFVFFLILFNLLFLAWTQGYFGSPANPDALRVQQQLLADQIRVVAQDVPPTETNKSEKIQAAPERKAAESCFLLNDLPPKDADNFEKLLAEKLPAAKTVRTANAGSTNYWVFIPPLDNKQEAEKKATQLKNHDVPEFFVIKDPGPNRFAISLGIFSSREAAEERLAVLREKGVKSAKIGTRENKPESASIEVSTLETDAKTLRQLVAERLPEHNPDTCKTKALAPQ
jgi:hypothetical protein